MAEARESTERRVVRIGDREVGDSRSVLVVAEAGVNHDGSIEQALQLVDVAVEAGADVVKFQVFRAAELASAAAPLAEYQRAAGESQQAMLTRLELSDADLAHIVQHCQRRQIMFLATPFGVNDVERLLRLNVSAIKIASTDLNNVPLIERAAASGLPVIASTGASTSEEISELIGRLDSWGARDRTVLLHCVSNYPAPLEAANLRAIAALRRAHGVPVGFSDHTSSTQIAGWAVAAGACMLEKHFTVDRRLPGPDHAMSLSPLQLAAYVAAARDAETALGTGRIGMSALEDEVRQVARRSVVAAADIPAGAVLTETMLTLKRPAGGITPDRLHELVGRRTTRSIPADTLLTWDLVQ